MEQLNKNHHRMNIRVYYEDTDAGGVVFYANYLKFCERGRTEYLRARGMENKPLMEREGFMFVVRHLVADYKAAAFLDDLLEMKTSVKEIKNASFIMLQEIYRGEELLFSADIVMACVGYGLKEGKAVRLPPHIKEILIKEI